MEEAGNVDVVIMIGSMVRETSLEEYMFNQVVSKLLDLSLSSDEPANFGISVSRMLSDRLSSLGLRSALSCLEGCHRTLEVLRDLR